ncbi:MAG: 30S ribosomal protein S20 [Chloroflexi bacterium]|nr:30S ribosomal protein S20 [Chloroflexota bacterium]
MPITKSAIKQMRVSVKRQRANKSYSSKSKSAVTKAENLLFSGEVEKGQTAVTSAISVLDRAAEKGIIHPNNAARRKSRLMKKLNAAKKPPTA